MQRFQINFTVAESDNFKSIETIVAEVVAQCEQECANSKGTSSYDYDRALWLNDWLVENTKYDSSLMYCSAEGVFNRGLGTCEGYHEAYAMLLNKAGIETRRVDDFGDAHVWTGIKLNGNWYNVDTTWNDTGDYTRSDLDLQRLYFALPSGIIQKVHPKWDGQYSIKYPDRATFDANSFADNYFIHSGEIAQYVSPYTAESGSYSVKSKLASKVTSFDLPVEKSSWPDNYKNVIYSLVAYQLGMQNWGDGIKVNVGYSDGSLHFQATYDGSTPSVSLTDAVVMDLDNQTYSGSALTPKPTVVLGGKTLVEGTDYQLSYENNVNASVLDKTKPAAVIIQGKGAYSGSLKKTFTIDQAEVYYAAVAAISAQQYTGSALTPKPTITLGGRTLTTSDYSISYKNNTNVGTATVTITGKGNYKGTKETTFKINAKTLPSNPVLSVTSYTYDGKAKTPGVTVKDGTKTLVNNTDYTVRYSNNTNVGTATVTVTGKGNYTGSKSTTFRINAKTLPSNPVLSATSYIYDGKAKTPGVTVKDGTKTLVNGTDYTVKYSNNVNVGTATVTVTGKGNYTGSKSTNFVISKPATQVVRSVVSYSTHVQNIGWQTAVQDGATAGTSGQSKRLEAIKISLPNQGYSGGIQYRTHIQNIGWESSWKSNGAASGTSGRALRLEAIQIKLTGDMAKNYDVYYRVHAQNFGWMGWAKNGASAGTAGYSYRLEAIQIKLVKKGGAAPGSTANAYRSALVSYSTHVQNIGWQTAVQDGATAGTSGQSKRLEAIKISLPNQGYSGGIQYRTHIQNIGWESSWKSNGAASGTSGRALRLEAIQIKLTGDMAKNYDVYYRVHAQNFGWMGWAKNGASAGTAGYSYRLEAIQIKLVKKGGAAPGSTANAYRSR